YGPKCVRSGSALAGRMGAEPDRSGPGTSETPGAATRISGVRFLHDEGMAGGEDGRPSEPDSASSVLSEQESCPNDSRRDREATDEGGVRSNQQSVISNQ